MTDHISQFSYSTPNSVKKLWFGVDTTIPSTTLLQNNFSLFEWVTRNKIYPSFWGRYLTGENALEEKEVCFLREKNCEILLIAKPDLGIATEEEGKALAIKVSALAKKKDFLNNTAIFVEINENDYATKSFMKGYACELLAKGYTPGFKANTDAHFPFDREFCRGLQAEPALFQQCLLWAVSPTLREYNETTNAHSLHPNCWKPFAPSGITRNEISVWQYGLNCHCICDNNDRRTSFNLNITQNELLIPKIVKGIDKAT